MNFHTLATAFLLGTALSACASQATNPAPAAAARLDRVLKAYLEHERYSGSALLARDGRILVDKGYGFANREMKTPVTASTPFNIGSVGKLFTQALVLEKVEEGDWQLDMTLSDLWPDSGIPNAGKATLRHLLSHQSGLGNYFEHSAYSLEQRELDEFIELIRTQEPAFDEPGADTEYSNSAFWVLAALLERHDSQGRSWRTILREEIFERAGMRHVRWFQPDEAAADRPRGYRVNPVGERRDETADDPRPGPDGGFYMPAGDLYRFARALRAGEWYSQELFEETLEITGPFLIDGCDFAVTWEVCRFSGVELVTKGGTTSGGGAELAFFRHGGADYTLILLSNFSNAPLENLEGVVRYMLDLPGAELPGARPSLLVHKGLQSGELPLEGEALRDWVDRNDVERNPLSLVMLALYYARHGQPENAKAVLRMSLSLFEGHELSRRVLERLERDDK